MNKAGKIGKLDPTGELGQAGRSGRIIGSGQTRYGVAYDQGIPFGRVGAKPVPGRTIDDKYWLGML